MTYHEKKNCIRSILLNEVGGERIFRASMGDASIVPDCFSASGQCNRDKSQEGSSLSLSLSPTGDPPQTKGFEEAPQ